MTPKPTEPAAEANQCARAIVSLVETKTGKSLDMSACVRIVQCVGLAIESQLAAQSAQIEELNKDRRTKREAIKCWQRHSAEVATELGCLSTTDAIIDRVKHINAQIEAAKEAVRALEEMLLVAQNADETGYITDVGFVDINELHTKVDAILARCAAAGIKTEE